MKKISLNLTLNYLNRNNKTKKTSSTITNVIPHNQGFSIKTMITGFLICLFIIKFVTLTLYIHEHNENTYKSGLFILSYINGLIISLILVNSQKPNTSYMELIKYLFCNIKIIIFNIFIFIIIKAFLSYIVTQFITISGNVICYNYILSIYIALNTTCPSLYIMHICSQLKLKLNHEAYDFSILKINLSIYNLILIVLGILVADMYIKPWVLNKINISVNCLYDWFKLYNNYKTSMLITHSKPGLLQVKILNKANLTKYTSIINRKLYAQQINKTKSGIFVKTTSNYPSNKIILPKKTSDIVKQVYTNMNQTNNVIIQTWNILGLNTKQYTNLHNFLSKLCKTEVECVTKHIKLISKPQKIEIILYYNALNSNEKYNFIINNINQITQKTPDNISHIGIKSKPNNYTMSNHKSISKLSNTYYTEKAITKVSSSGSSYNTQQYTDGYLNNNSNQLIYWDANNLGSQANVNPFSNTGYDPSGFNQVPQNNFIDLDLCDLTIENGQGHTGTSYYCKWGRDKIVRRARECNIDARLLGEDMSNQGITCYQIAKYLPRNSDNLIIFNDPGYIYNIRSTHLQVNQLALHLAQLITELNHTHTADILIHNGLFTGLSDNCKLILYQDIMHKLSTSELELLIKCIKLNPTHYNPTYTEHGLPLDYVIANIGNAYELPNLLHTLGLDDAYPIYTIRDTTSILGLKFANLATVANISVCFKYKPLGLYYLNTLSVYNQIQDQIHLYHDTCYGFCPKGRVVLRDMYSDSENIQSANNILRANLSIEDYMKTQADPELRLLALEKQLEKTVRCNRLNKVLEQIVTDIIPGRIPFNTANLNHDLNIAALSDKIARLCEERALCEYTLPKIETRSNIHRVYAPSITVVYRQISNQLNYHERLLLIKCLRAFPTIYQVRFNNGGIAGHTIIFDLANGYQLCNRLNRYGLPQNIE